MASVPQILNPDGRRFLQSAPGQHPLSLKVCGSCDYPEKVKSLLAHDGITTGGIGAPDPEPDGRELLQGAPGQNLRSAW